MLHKMDVIKFISVLFFICFCIGCKNNPTVKEKEIVAVPEKMDDQISDNIKAILIFAKESNGIISDSTKLSLFNLVNSFYEKNSYEGIWSREENWKPVADSMFQFIKNSRYYGLYPEDYHYQELDSLRSKIQNDSLTRMDAVIWTKADLLFTDAFMKTLKDLKEGRMLPDSVSIASKMNYTDSFFIDKLKGTGVPNLVFASFDRVGLDETEGDGI